MSKICKHDGCGNPVIGARMGSNGYMIRYNQCSPCSNMISKYGIHNGDRKRILAAQKHQCAICEKTIVNMGQTKRGDDCKNHAALDHNHETGKVRGILCTPCNRALGLFGDSIEVLIKATEYLEAHK